MPEQRLSKILNYRKSLESQARQSFVEVSNRLNDEKIKLESINSLLKNLRRKKEKSFNFFTHSNLSLIYSNYAEGLKIELENKNGVINSIQLEKAAAADNLISKTKERKVLKSYIEKSNEQQKKKDLQREEQILDELSIRIDSLADNHEKL
ncbi:MAG: flagellar export protein FliJ [Nitrospinota bacterium]